MLSHEIFALFYDIWLSSVPGGRDFEPRLGGMGNLNRNCPVFLAEQTCHIFFIQRCFEVQISLSRADGSEKEIAKKVPVTNLAFYKKFDCNTALGWGNWTKQSSKVKMSGELPEGDVEASNWSTHKLHRSFSFRPTNVAAMSGKRIVMLKARLKSKDFCILIKGKPCFTDWPSKGDFKVINVLSLALCQSESDARQFTLSETN